mmetsp:Transcript_67752/g.214435  ORF Transcript_67752/g.214435 Transcript_67752/m.214435 type:complete len:101 (-) Transcript_67752:322-624(-)
MTRYYMTHFVTHYSCYLVLVNGDFKQTCINTYFATGQGECIHLRIIKNNYFPNTIKNFFWNVNDDAVSYALHILILHRNIRHFNVLFHAGKCLYAHFAQL